MNRKIILFSLITLTLLLLVITFVVNEKKLSRIDSLSLNYHPKKTSLEKPIIQVERHLNDEVFNARKSDEKPVLKDYEKLGTLELEEISSRYQFDQLEIEDNHLVLSHKNRVIVENIVNDLDQIEILNGKERIQDSSSLIIGEVAADELIDIIVKFSSYKAHIHGLDDMLNDAALTQEDVDWNLDVLIETQNTTFGEDVANQLFYVERETRIAMKNFERRIDDGEAIDESTIKNMNLEYVRIISEDVNSTF